MVSLLQLLGKIQEGFLLDSRYSLMEQVKIMMMKNGLIIDQGKPNDLVKKHGRQNLEEVFLKLVRN